MGSTRFLIIETEEERVRQLTAALRELEDRDPYIQHTRSLADSAQVLAQEDFDVIFSPLELPDSFGVEILGQIQQITTAPIIVLSETENEAEKDQLFRNGASEVINLKRHGKYVLALMIKFAMGRHSIVEEKQKRISELIDANIDHARAIEDLRSLTEQLADEVARRQAAEQKNSLLATVIEHLSEAVVVTEMDGNIVYVNPAFERSSGYRAPELLGRVAPAYGLTTR